MVEIGDPTTSDGDEAKANPSFAPSGADRYLRKELLGEGTYGVVYKAIDIKTEQIVAIKKIRLGNCKEGINVTALREIKLLKELKHPEIIELIDTFPRKGNLHLVFEFMESDLEVVIRDRNIVLSPADIKSYMQMTLKGLAFCHKKWVMHRDMKPNNLLIAPTGHLKLADFGLARIFGSPDRRFTHQVFARWYRAPELLFGCKNYGPAVDVWAVGCIFAELLLRRPLLLGHSDIDQLGKIFAAFGTPKLDQWPDVVNLPDYVEYQFIAAPPLRTLFPMASDDALDLLLRMFTYDPRARISAEEALDHRYFSSLPAPTSPSQLPRPSHKVGSSNPEAHIVISPPRKLRKVALQYDCLEASVQCAENARQYSHIPDSACKTGYMPMSVDMSVLFGTKPIPRPQLTSADKNILKRKLDLDSADDY